MSSEREIDPRSYENSNNLNRFNDRGPLGMKSWVPGYAMQNWSGSAAC